MTEGRDIFVEELIAKERPYCPPEHMDSEDPMFVLYTSGSTGANATLSTTIYIYVLLWVVCVFCNNLDIAISYAYCVR